MKKKKRLLNFGAALIFLIIYTIPFLNWEKKNKVYSDFIEIERALHYNALLNNPGLFDSLSIFESRVNEFTLNNPVPENIVLGEFISNSDTSSISINELRSDFFLKVNTIDDFYRKSERKSNHIMFLFLLLGNGLLWIIRYYIKKLVQ